MSGVSNIGRGVALDPVRRQAAMDVLLKTLGVDSVMLRDHGLTFSVPITELVAHLDDDDLECLDGLARSAAIAMTLTAAGRDRLRFGFIFEQPQEHVGELLVLAQEFLVLERDVKVVDEADFDDLARKLHAVWTRRRERRDEVENEVAQRRRGDLVRCEAEARARFHSEDFSLSDLIDVQIEALRAMSGKLRDGAPT